MHGRTAILLATALIVAVVHAGLAIAGGASKGREVTVADGKFAHRSWSLSVQGQHRQRCFELTLDSPRQSSTGGTCGRDRRPPLFSPVMSLSDLNDSATVELVVTRKRVRTMRLRIGHPKSDRPSEWIRARNRRITRHQARRAHVRRHFRFAVLHSRGLMCVKQAVLFNREGDRIDKLRGPCEF